MARFFTNLINMLSKYIFLLLLILTRQSPGFGWNEKVTHAYLSLSLLTYEVNFHGLNNSVYYTLNHTQIILLLEMY